MATSNTPQTSKAHAETYLASLLGKNLRVTTTDTRMFLGQFKCTDSDQNIILSQTFEYRLPPFPKSSPSNPSNPVQTTTIKADLISRYLGLVVVPGEHITRVEVEEFESQLSLSQRKALGLKNEKVGGMGEGRIEGSEVGGVLGAEAGAGAEGSCLG